MTSTSLPELPDGAETCNHLPGCHLAHVPNLFASCACGLVPQEAAPVKPKSVTKAVEVTAKDSLLAATSVISDSDPSRGATGQIVASALFVQGLRAFDDRLFRESSEKVLEDFQAAYDELPDLPDGQWTMEVPTNAFVIGRLAAKEYGLEFPTLVRQCVAYALKNRV